MYNLEQNAPSVNNLKQNNTPSRRWLRHHGAIPSFVVLLAENTRDLLFLTVVAGEK